MLGDHCTDPSIARVNNVKLTGERYLAHLTRQTRLAVAATDVRPVDAFEVVDHNLVPESARCRDLRKLGYRSCVDDDQRSEGVGAAQAVGNSVAVFNLGGEPGERAGLSAKSVMPLVGGGGSLFVSIRHVVLRN